MFATVIAITVPVWAVGSLLAWRLCRAAACAERRAATRPGPAPIDR